MSGDRPAEGEAQGAAPVRARRADARRNLLVLLQAAREVFAASGVEAPVREIAERAGVGIGTIYRHFPTRADLVAAVFAQEIDACADAAAELAARHTPVEALRLWMRRFVELATLKRGLAQALHSGDPAFETLPARREQRLQPAFRKLFAAAAQTGVLRDDIDADDFLNAAAGLCGSLSEGQADRAQRLVALLFDGLRCAGRQAADSRTPG